MYTSVPRRHRRVFLFAVAIHSVLECFSIHFTIRRLEKQLFDLMSIRVVLYHTLPKSDASASCPNRLNALHHSVTPIKSLCIFSAELESLEKLVVFK